MRITRVSHFIKGDKAPDFSAILHDGSVLTSRELHQQKYILFFYNHDGSETCTKEACNVRDHYDLLTKKGYKIFGVSEDSPKKHQKFISKFNLPYPLIADQENQLAKTFDLYGEKEFMGRISDTVHRTTFVIDAEGMIEAVIHPVDAARHVAQILDALNTEP